ncbi:MAG: hypothetical protein ABFS10_06760 [Bacteroidota bacterium]
MKNSEFEIAKLSSHLFWDVNAKKLRVEDDFPFIVKRILEYGLIGDWKLLSSHFSIDEITAVAKSFRDLDSRSLSFISTLSDEPKENFRCYITKQLTPPHWIS